MPETQEELVARLNTLPEDEAIREAERWIEAAADTPQAFDPCDPDAPIRRWAGEHRDGVYRRYCAVRAIRKDRSPC